jgi:putative transposase
MPVEGRTGGGYKAHGLEDITRIHHRNRRSGAVGAERWVRSVKEECLARFILCGEASLRHALTQYVTHFHHERNHQGKGNVLLFPVVRQDAPCEGPIQCRKRLGGLLKYYERDAA